MHVPGLGPKTARRLWEELGISTLDELRVAAETQQPPRRSRASAPKTRGARARRARQARGVAQRRPAACCSAACCRSCATLVAELAAHPACERVSEAGSVRRRAETVARRRPDRDLLRSGGADRGVRRRTSASPRWPRTARRRRPSSRTTASASTCASSRPSATATSSSTSPARRTTTSRCARTPSARASRSPSTGSRRSRRARSFTAADEEARLRAARLRVDPARAAREPRRARGRAARRACPTLVELGDLQRRPPHAHDLVGRARDARRDGRRRAKACGHRYIAICDHAKRLREGALERQAEEIAAVERAGRRGSRSCAGSRWTSAATARSTWTTSCSRASTG